MITQPTCPGEHCAACTGEACERCGTGLRTQVNQPSCEHDVVQRHAPEDPR
jgi:hypothetical protein